MHNGYPEQYELDAIGHFVGTPEEFVERVEYLVEGYGGVNTEGTDNYVEVRIVTGGWSGNEDVVGVIESGIDGGSTTMFSLAYWESSHRGGLHVYRVPNDHWDSARFLGDVLKFNAAESNA